MISTDPAHSLSESLGVELGPEPRPVGDRLWGQEVNAQEEMERHWSGVQEWLGELFIERGVDRISAEELTVPPGMDELFSLLRLQAAHESGDWDAIIVDCAPTGETLRLLSFPDVARWWIEKVFPIERQILAAARPIARSLLDIPLPSQAVFADIQRLSQNLIAMNEILRDRDRSTIRLVMNPDKMVIGEAMRTFTYLNLYGYLTDAVIVNRVFPSDVGDYFAGWRRVQEEHLELVRSAFAPGAGPVRALLRPGGCRGRDARPPRRRRCSSRRRARPGGGPARPLTQELERVRRRRRACAWCCRSPRKGDISLKKIGLELIVGVDGQRRDDHAALGAGRVPARRARRSRTARSR